MQDYHWVWLAAHPSRNEAWLKEKLKEGFDIHHLDGDRANNDPRNLVLIEHMDHMMLHGGRTLGRLTRLKRRPKKGPRLTRAQRVASEAYLEFKSRYGDKWA